MSENNLSFYFKRWFWNRYILLAVVVMVTAVLFVFNQRKLFSIIDLNEGKDEAYEIALAQQQAELAVLGLKKDPAQLSYVEIMQSKDYDFNDREALKLQDSDSDGLSDYQEIYIYQTSAFLEDTDGDGLSDDLEIKSGSDPICAKGDICGVDNTEKDLAQKAAFIEDIYVADDNDELLDDLNSIDITDMDPGFLRQALLESGLAASEIDVLSDDEIIQLYQMGIETYEEEQVANQVTEEMIIDEDNLENLTAGEIRYLLIQEGAEEAVLADISDSELLKLFKDALVEEN